MRFGLHQPLIAVALAATLAAPAPARTDPTPEQRIERLERQLRQVQRRLFPKGQPVDTAGLADEPAATQREVGDLATRLDSIERQMAELTRQSEEGGHRLGALEAELARFRADQDTRWRAVQGAAEPAVPPPGAALAAEPAPPPAPQPKVELSPAASASPQAAATSFSDPAEAAYDAGYRLWMAAKYEEAIGALKAMIASFPSHRRVSWANNLIGRSLLDSGQPRAAAEALLANYRGNPRGERAADSLFYLGQALVKLGQPGQACKAYAELSDVYGASMRDQLRELLPKARSEAKCS